MTERTFLAQVLRHPIHVSSIVSAFYSDLGSDFVSRGETHDFWELVYVDRGQLHVETDTRTYPLAQGQITFHPPMEYHRHISNISPKTSLCIFSFYCDSPSLLPLARQTLSLNEEQRQALHTALKTVSNIFNSLVDARETLYLVKNESVTPIHEQLFTNYLEIFLLLCIRDYDCRQSSTLSPVDAMTRSRIEQLGQRAVDYLVSHITQTVTIQSLCAALGCSKTTLSTAFRSYTGTSIIPYFNRLKIEEAKNLIRFADLSLTEIADRLNFCNLNYFSSAFKRYTGMHPREYAKSLRVYNATYLMQAEHNAILHQE